MNLQATLRRVYDELLPQLGSGRVADYIPALARVDPRKFGLAVVTVDGQLATVGDAAEPFSIQSISKVFTLTLALGQVGNDLWQRVGREPSGSAFNSIVQLENEHGIPRNPFINAVWSPGLNANGNSALGSLALERLAQETGWSVFR